MLLKKFSVFASEPGRAFKASPLIRDASSWIPVDLEKKSNYLVLKSVYRFDKENLFITKTLYLEL